MDVSNSPAGYTSRILRNTMLYRVWWAKMSDSKGLT